MQSLRSKRYTDREDTGEFNCYTLTGVCHSPSEGSIAARSAQRTRLADNRPALLTCRSPEIQGHIKLPTSIICGERDDVKRTLHELYFNVPATSS
jgi:hypothetical protein